jgi:hypothetical protein
LHQQRFIAGQAGDRRTYDRFEAFEVTAFWLKGEKNHFNNFGDGLQAPVVGRTIREQMASARLAVTDLLSAIERQVEMANALARLIRSIPDWTYEIERQGTVPACFRPMMSGHLHAPVLAQGEFLGKQRVDSFEGVHFAALDPAHRASRISMARGSSQPRFA